MNLPVDAAAPNQIRIRAVFVPDGQSVTSELLQGMTDTMRVRAELVIDADSDGPESFAADTSRPEA